MGQSTSVDMSSHTNQAASVTRVVHHNDAGEVSPSASEHQHKCQQPYKNVAQLEIAATPRVTLPSASPDSQGERLLESQVPSVRCRKCTITGVDPDKYCLHVTAKTAESIEQPEFNVASLPRSKVPAFVWYMLSNLGIVRRFKISKHAALNLVNGIEHFYNHLDISLEWVKALELAHGMYVILRRRRENCLALDEMFNCAKSLPSSIGDGIDRLQGLSLILAALVSGLDEIPRPSKFKLDKLISSEFLPRKGLPWRVIQKTAKDIFLRLTTVEAQRLEVTLTSVIRVMSDPMSLEEYGEYYAAQGQKPKVGDDLHQRSSFVVPSTPSWNTCGAPESPCSPVTTRRPQGGDLHDTCEHIEHVGSNEIKKPQPQPTLEPIPFNPPELAVATA